MGSGSSKNRPPRPLAPDRGGGGEQRGLMRSQRLALALALLASLDNSVAERGWARSARLRAAVARMVADLLA